MIIKRKLYSQVEEEERLYTKTATVKVSVNKIKDLKDANTIKKVLREKAGKPFSGNKEEVLAAIRRQRNNIKSRLSALENSMNHSDQLFNEAKELTTRFNRLEQAGKLRAKKAFAKNAKIGAGIAAGTAAVGTGVYLAKKHHNKKKNEKKED